MKYWDMVERIAHEWQTAIDCNLLYSDPEKGNDQYTVGKLVGMMDAAAFIGGVSYGDVCYDVRRYADTHGMSVSSYPLF